MSFLDSIQARHDAAKATLENSAVKIEDLEFAAQQTKSEAVRVRGQNVTPHYSQAHAIWTEAEHALERYRREIKTAWSTIEDCEPILNARAQLPNAQRAYCAAKESADSADAEATNLQKLIQEIEGEIRELGERAAAALELHGQAAVSARLSGQAAPATPKAILSLNTDIESRRATLESAGQMLASAQARHTQASQAAERWRTDWQQKRQYVAEIEYRDLLASIAPAVASYLAATGGNEIRFSPEQETIGAARELLAAELEQTE